jgi:DNA-directed RNA polymerase subunit M/transcription elongation factor TFIIS
MPETITILRCDNCGEEYPETAPEQWDETRGVGQVKPLHLIHHLTERLDPGSPVPHGECNQCGAFVYAEEKTVPSKPACDAEAAIYNAIAPHLQDDDNAAHDALGKVAEIIDREAGIPEMLAELERLRGKDEPRENRPWQRLDTISTDTMQLLCRLAGIPDPEKPDTEDEHEAETIYQDRLNRAVYEALTERARLRALLELQTDAATGLRLGGVALRAENNQLRAKIDDMEHGIEELEGDHADLVAETEKLREAASFAIYWIPRNANEAMRKLCEATGSKPGYTLPLTVLQKENERMRQVILRVVSAWETPDDLTPEEVAHVYEEATAMLASVEPAPKPGFDENGEINCDCGNTPNQSGFDHCDAEGNLMEPVRGSDWQGHYRCADCGKVWKQPGEGGA